MDKINKYVSKLFPFYGIILTYTLLKPAGHQQDFFFMFNGIDKVVHFSAFITLTYLALAFFNKRIIVSYTIQLLYIYAILTEILQDTMAVGRSLEFADLIADSLGIVVGYIIYNYTQNKV